MTQNTQSTNTTSGQNNFVEIDRGGTLRYGIGRIYWNYDFEPLSGLLYNPEVAKVYAEVGKEFAQLLSLNKIVELSSCVKMKTTAKRSFFDKWTPPIYIEDGLITEVKKNLKEGKYENCIWADYMWYLEIPLRSPITNMLTNHRDYDRQIHILSEKLDLSLVKDIIESRIDDGAVGIRIYPHSKIEYIENDKETLRSYVHRDDFIVHIAFDDKWTGIHVEPNPKYMNYEQLIEIIEPIFEKHGLKLKNKNEPNPNLKSGFSKEEEYTYHKIYPCAGYEFID